MSGHLSFVDYGTSDSGKTRRVEVRAASDGGLLGLIHWYAPWRRYVFYPQLDTLFDAACLDEISAVCRQMLDRHRAKIAREKRTRKGCDAA